MDRRVWRQAPRITPPDLIGWNVRDVVRQPDNHPAAASDLCFGGLLCGLEYAFVKESRLRAFHAARLLDGLHYQRMVGSEVLKQLRGRGVHHDCGFILRL